MMEVDSDYEFNAPKYIDFLSNEPENEQIDTWFGEYMKLARGVGSGFWFLARFSVDCSLLFTLI